jgi:hypothetical protein
MHSDLEKPGTLAQLLRALPEDPSPPFPWREFERRAAHRAVGRHGVGGGQALAAVALLALAALALSVRLRGPAPAAPRTPMRPAVTDVTRSPALAPAARSRALTAERTDVLERWLASLPDEPALVHVGTRAAVTGLEDRIAQVDDLLSAARVAQDPPARLAALQKERTRLVGALLQVRYAESLADASD